LRRFSAALLAISLLSCTTSAPRQRVIAASMPPVGAMVRLVTGDAIPVVTLLPAGRSPHDFEPSASDVKRMQGAELYVYVGEDIDGWMRRSAQAVAGENAPILAMRTVAPGADRDPHLWLDLDVVRAFLPVLAEQLAAADPPGAAAYRARAAAALDSLTAFDAWAREELAGVHDVPFALLHSAFTSFCRRYDLSMVGILMMHPEGEALPRSLGDVARELESSNAHVVFAEPQHPRRLAESVAAEIGGRVGMVDPQGGPDLPGRDTYFGLLRWNVQSLAESLRGAR
jgi:zinc transport system substrate-binding protein